LSAVTPGIAPFIPYYEVLLQKHSTTKASGTQKRSRHFEDAKRAFDENTSENLVRARKARTLISVTGVLDERAPRKGHPNPCRHTTTTPWEL